MRDWRPSEQERVAVRKALGSAPTAIMPADDLRQEALIALWRTASSRRPGVEQDAVAVARNAMIDAIRSWHGRTPRSAQRPAGQVLAWDAANDPRRSADCPVSALVARQALRDMYGASEATRKVASAMVEHGTPLAVRQALGLSGNTVHWHLRKLRALLSAHMYVPMPSPNQHAQRG